MSNDGNIFLEIIEEEEKEKEKDSNDEDSNDEDLNDEDLENEEEMEKNFLEINFSELDINDNFFGNISENLEKTDEKLSNNQYPIEATQT